MDHIVELLKYHICITPLTKQRYPCKPSAFIYKSNKITSNLEGWNLCRSQISECMTLKGWEHLLKLGEYGKRLFFVNSH